MMHGQENTKSKSSVAVACFLPGRVKDLSAPLYLSVAHICVGKADAQKKFCLLPSVSTTFNPKPLTSKFCLVHFDHFSNRVDTLVPFILGSIPCGMLLFTEFC